MDRFLAIVNPAAGGGRCGKRAPGAVALLREAGLDIEVRETTAPGDATAIARDAHSEGWRAFLAIGGDGTLFETVNGLDRAWGERAEAADRVRIAPLPLGTGNSFLRDFTDEGADGAIAAIAAGRKRPCDLLRIDHRDGTHYLINLLGLGFPALVTSLVNRRLKSFGAPGYVLGVLAVLARLQPIPMRLRADRDAAIDTARTFLCVCNSRFTGGAMEMAPDALVNDGLLDVIHVDPASRWTLLRTFPKIFSGTHLAHPKVHHARARRLDFDLDEPLDAVLDGEIFRLRLRAIEVVPEAIDLAL